MAEEVDVLRSFAQEGVADITAPDETAVVAPDLNDVQAAEVDGSTELLRVLEVARKQLMDVGAVHAAGQLELELRKEKSRLREVSREDPDVLLGMARARDALEAESRKRRLAIEDANRQVMSKQKLRREIKDAEATLQKTKQLIAEQEQIAEARHVVKKFRLEYLGDGARGCGGAAGRKRRDEVMDRMAKLGSGLSPQQRNDWVWFKEAYDRKMHGAHGDDWVRIFVGYMQEVLNQLYDGTPNAFSLFVHKETLRSFAADRGLVLP